MMAMVLFMQYINLPLGLAACLRILVRQMALIFQR